MCLAGDLTDVISCWLNVGMELITFIADPTRKRALVEALGASEGYLWQIATAWRGKRAGPELAIKIEKATTEIGPEAVPRHSLRPDLWPKTVTAANDPDADPDAGRIVPVEGA